MYKTSFALNVPDKPLTNRPCCCRLGALLTLDTLTDETGNATAQLTAQTRAWFKAARFDVATVTDVIDSLENGLKHVIQVAKCLGDIV
jgi:hypothetical protein